MASLHGKAVGSSLSICLYSDSSDPWGGDRSGGRTSATCRATLLLQESIGPKHWDGKSPSGVARYVGAARRTVEPFSRFVAVCVIRIMAPPA
jgi:hypothetical protein